MMLFALGRGIAWCGTCLFFQNVAEILLLTCRLSQHLLLLPDQLHLLVLITSKQMQQADCVLYVNILKSNRVKLF